MYSVVKNTIISFCQFTFIIVSQLYGVYLISTFAIKCLIRFFVTNEVHFNV